MPPLIAARMWLNQPQLSAITDRSTTVRPTTANATITIATRDGTAAMTVARIAGTIAVETRDDMTAQPEKLDQLTVEVLATNLVVGQPAKPTPILTETMFGPSAPLNTPESMTAMETNTTWWK